MLIYKGPSTDRCKCSLNINEVFLNHNIFLRLSVANPDRDAENVIRWSEPGRKRISVRGGTIVVGTRTGGTSISDGPASST